MLLSSLCFRLLRRNPFLSRNRAFYQFAPQRLGLFVEFVFPGKHFGRGKPVPYRHMPKRPHDIGKIHLLGASGIAPVAHHAQPDGLRRQNFLTHAVQHFTDDGPAVVFLVDVRDGAAGCAGAARETSFDVRPTRHERYFVPKSRIEFFYDYHVCVTLCHDDRSPYDFKCRI
jgi:hypothetical protein